MKVLLTALVAVFSITVPSSECMAQVPVTVIMRSGQSLGVELMGFRAGAFTFRRTTVSGSTSKPLRR
jgi:hypothetical protein